MRIFSGVAIAIVFLAWVLYRLVVKKDLKKNLPGFYIGLCFLAVWALIYWKMLS